MAGLLFCSCGTAYTPSPELVRITPDTAGTYAVADSTAPYPFYRTGTAAVIPGPQYEAGAVRRFFLGDGYRDVWTAPVDLPVIDLTRTVGGLAPLRLGGGNQSTSLHLRGADGHEYRLRLIEKDEGRSIPEIWRGTFVEGMAEDVGSALNPFAPSAVAPLAQAAGIYHTAPVLVYVPDVPELGPFRSRFAGEVALFERKPDEDQSEARRFGYARNVVGTEKLLEVLREDSMAHVDQRAYARARLFDMLIGDSDRHAGQWRWAEFETPSGTRYLPVPVDRDFAFSRFDGFLNQFARRTGYMRLARLTNFNEDISNLKNLNWQARSIDQRFTDQLSRTDWIAIADSLQTTLTDDAIEQSIRTWPEAVFQRIGPWTITVLKARRDQITHVAARYAELLEAEDAPLNGPILELK